MDSTDSGPPHCAISGHSRTWQTGRIEAAAELATQAKLHAGQRDRSVLAEGSQTVGSAHDRHGSVQQAYVRSGSGPSPS